MSASPGHLESGLYTVLFQFQLQRCKVAMRPRVVGVDRHPLGPLRLWVDGVQADCLDT